LKLVEFDLGPLFAAAAGPFAGEGDMFSHAAHRAAIQATPVDSVVVQYFVQVGHSCHFRHPQHHVPVVDEPKLPISSQVPQ
jgi:hypothetical protein